MKIGDKYKHITSQLIWKITEYDSISDVIRIMCDFGNVVSWRRISTPELIRNYIKTEGDDQLDWFGNFPVGKEQEELKQYQCYHDFKEYIGLRESYKFCTKCDLKKGMDE